MIRVLRKVQRFPELTDLMHKSFLLATDQLQLLIAAANDHLQPLQFALKFLIADDQCLFVLSHYCDFLLVDPPLYFDILTLLAIVVVQMLIILLPLLESQLQLLVLLTERLQLSHLPFQQSLGSIKLTVLAELSTKLTRHQIKLRLQFVNIFQQHRVL